MGSAESARGVLYDWTRMGRNRLDSGTSLGSSAALPWRGPWRHAHSSPKLRIGVTRIRSWTSPIYVAFNQRLQELG